MVRQAQYIRWTFTINNYSPEDESHIQGLVPDTVKYLAYSHEEGKEEKTPHLQGFMWLQKKSQLAALKKAFHATAHLEPMLGTFDQNVAYCSKQSVLKEFGSRPAQGKRTDLVALGEAIKENKRLRPVMQDFPAETIKYHKGMEKLHQAYHEPAQDAPPVVPEVLRFSDRSAAVAEATRRGLSYWTKSRGTSKWWNGYQYEPVVILEDQQSQDIDLHLDGFAYSVETKGAVIVVQPQAYFVVTNSKETLRASRLE